MTVEAPRSSKEPSLPIKVLEILSTIPLNNDFWTIHEEQRDAIVINPQGKAISTKIKETGFTTRLETTRGQISVSLIQQRCDFPKLNDFPLILRIINTGDEDYPVEFFMDSPEARLVSDETSLAYGLFINLQKVLITNDVEKESPDEIRAKRTVYDAIEEYYKERFDD